MFNIKKLKFNFLLKALLLEKFETINFKKILMASIQTIVPSIKIDKTKIK